MPGAVRLMGQPFRSCAVRIPPESSGGGTPPQMDHRREDAAADDTREFFTSTHLKCENKFLLQILWLFVVFCLPPHVVGGAYVK